MKQFMLIAMLGLVAVVSQASERHTRVFKIAEGPNKLDRTPYTLTMTSSDLRRYPKAIVTFEVSTESTRAPGSISPADTSPGYLRAKRHYVRLDEGQFGRNGEPQVVFNQKAHKVFIGFLGKEGKTFFYKELSEQ